jgi:hypothetical protein
VTLNSVTSTGFRLTSRRGIVLFGYVRSTMSSGAESVRPPSVVLMLAPSVNSCSAWSLCVTQSGKNKFRWQDALPVHYHRSSHSIPRASIYRRGFG